MWHSEILWRVLQGWMQDEKLISFILSCHVYLWCAQQLKTWQRKLSSIQIQGKVRQGIWKRRLWPVSAAAITAIHHHLGDNNFKSNFPLNSKTLRKFFTNVEDSLLEQWGVFYFLGQLMLQYTWYLNTWTLRYSGGGFCSSRSRNNTLHSDPARARFWNQRSWGEGKSFPFSCKFNLWLMISISQFQSQSPL